MYTLLLVIFIISVILLIPVILMQSGSGAEAGMFGSNLTLGAFGAKSSEVLVNMTKWLIAIFFVSAFLIGYIKVRETKQLSNNPNAAVEQTTTATNTNAAQETVPESTVPAEGGQTGATLPAGAQTLPTLPSAGNPNGSAPLQIPQQ